MSAPAAFALHDVTVTYAGRLALDAVSVAIPQGRLVAVVGPNGSGKSTLVKACIGRVPLAGGSVEVLGGPVGGARRSVAYVPQRRDVDLDFPVTVGEVVAMGRHAERGWLRRLRHEDRELAHAAMARVGIEPLARRPIGELSGGQLQRTFVARALAQDRPVLLLDEPFVGIDVATEQRLRELLRELVDSDGRSVVVVDHDLPAVREHADLALLMATRLAAVGSPQQVLDDDHLLRTFAGIES